MWYEGAKWKISGYLRSEDVTGVILGNRGSFMKSATVRVKRCYANVHHGGLTLKISEQSCGTFRSMKQTFPLQVRQIHSTLLEWRRSQS